MSRRSQKLRSLTPIQEIQQMASSAENSSAESGQESDSDGEYAFSGEETFGSQRKRAQSTHQRAREDATLSDMLTPQDVLPFFQWDMDVASQTEREQQEPLTEEESAALGTNRRSTLGHSDEVTAVFVDYKCRGQDGATRLFSASLDHTILVWDVAKLNSKLTAPVPMAKFVGHKEGINAIVTDGNRVFSAGDDKTIIVWEKKTGTILFRIEGHTEWIYSLHYEADATGGKLYSGGYDNQVIKWDVPTNGAPKEVLRFRGHAGSVLCITSDEKHLYTGSLDNTIRVWNKETGELVRTLNKHQDGVSCIVVDKEKIYTGSYDKSIRIWEKETGDSLLCLEGHKSWIYTLSVINERIYSGSDDGSIHSWHAPSGHMIQTLRTTARTRIRSLAVYEEIKKAEEKVVPISTSPKPDRKRDATPELPKSPKETRMLTIFAGLANQRIQVWIEVPGRPILKSAKGIHTSSVKCVCVDDTRLYTASPDKTIQIWNKFTGQHIQTIRGHKKGVKSLFVTTDKIYSGSEDQTVRMWDKKTGEFIKELEGHTAGVNCLFVDEGRIYSGSSDGTVRVWDKDTGDFVAELKNMLRQKYKVKDKMNDQGGLVEVISLFVNEAHVYTGGTDGVLRIFDKRKVENPFKRYPKKELLEFKHKQDLNCIFVDRDYVYTGSDDKSIRIFKKNINKKAYKNEAFRETGKKRPVTNEWIFVDKIKTVAAVWCLVVDDCRLYSGHFDGTVQIREKLNFPHFAGENKPKGPIEHEVVQVLDNHQGTVYSIAVDEGRVYSGSYDKSVQISHRAFCGLSAFFKQCMSLGTKANRRLIKDNMENETGLTPLMAAAASGSLENAFVEMDDMKEVPEEETNELLKRAWKYMERNGEVPGRVMSDIKVKRKGAPAEEDAAGAPPSPPPSLSPLSLIASDHKTKDQVPTETPRFYVSDPDNRRVVVADIITEPNGGYKPVFKEQVSSVDPSYTNKYGVSAIFYALSGGHWDFLEILSQKLAQRDRKRKKGSRRNTIGENRSKAKSADLLVLKTDIDTYALLRNRAIANDTEFFERLLKSNVKFDQKVVLEEAIKHNHLWFVQNWPDVNTPFALHLACYYGRPDCVRELMNRDDTKVNLPDPRNKGRIPLHICHLTAAHSEFDKLPLQKQYIPQPVYDKYDFELTMRRYECFQVITASKEITKRPNFYSRCTDAAKSFTIYDQALTLHESVMNRLRQPRGEISDREVMNRDKALFQASVEELDYYHNIPEVQRTRNRWTTFTFFKDIIIYLFFLCLITSVALYDSTDGKDTGFLLSNSIKNQLIGGAFSEIGSVDDFWEWYDTSFLPSMYQDDLGNGFVMNFNKMIGNMRLRHIRMRSDSCSRRSFSEAEIPFCIAEGFDSEYEFTERYGPNDTFVWAHNHGGEKIWGSDDEWYPTSGYYEDFLPNNKMNLSQALALSARLQTDGWIAEDTRILFVAFSLYSQNIQGAFASVVLQIRFPATGDTVVSDEVIVLSPHSYYFSPDGITIAKIVLELICILYIIKEFMLTEILEIKESIENSQELATRLQESVGTRVIKNPTLNGLVGYLSEAWNYYEWTMIFVFIIIVGLRVSSIIQWADLDIYQQEGHVNLQPLALTLAYEQDLFAFFLVMFWLRVLKFLRLPPYTGAVVQSVMDTLKSSQALVFIVIVIYVLISFSMAYHVAFGPDLEGFSGISRSIITNSQLLFGNSDYDALVSSNRIFAPLLYFTFLILAALVLMNLLVGVLGEAYSEVQQRNTIRWNRYITRLMIESLPTRCNMSSFENRALFSIKSFMRALRRKLRSIFRRPEDRTTSNVEDLGPMHAASFVYDHPDVERQLREDEDSDDDEDYEEGAKEQEQKVIYYHEDEIDDMATSLINPEEKQQREDEEKAEEEEREKEKKEQEKEHLNSRINTLETRVTRMETKLDLMLQLMKEIKQGTLAATPAPTDNNNRQ